MTSILLHDYVEQVEKLIDADRLVEAIEHCRHILSHYPRHIDTYRALGKALLEKQDYSAASDLFLRILGAEPNDFISHVGLSIIYKDQSQYDQALWHLERAHEIQPYNIAIQGELRELYAATTDSRPGIIPLTPGALARLYVQGELYQQAILELRRILADEPERFDLQVLLAEALWRDDQRIDAEEICLNVLKELPNCIVANAILAEIWLQIGRVPEAQKYLQCLHDLTWQTQKSLDKESIEGQAFIAEGAFKLPAEAPLEFLETGMVIAQDAPAPTADWVGEMTFDDPPAAAEASGTPVLEPESGMHSYDWLADIGETAVEETVQTNPKQIASETDWFSQEKAKEALNLSTGELNAEWLADLRGEENQESDSGFQPLDLSTQSHELEQTQDSDWFGEDEELSEGLFAELQDTPVAAEDTAVDTDHDWLNALVDDDTPSAGEKSNLEIDATNLMDDKLMDWALDDERDEPHVVKEPKTPFWLSEMASEAIEAVELNPDEAIDWLAEEPSDNALDELSDSAEPLAEALDEGEAALDWLSDLSEEPLDGNALLAEEDDDDFEDEYDVYEDEGVTAVSEPDGPEDYLPEKLVLDTDSLGDADDWLSALTEGGIDDDITWEDAATAETPIDDQLLNAATEELEALSDADDWMESASADLDAILDKIQDEEEDFPNLELSDMEDAAVAEIPDWLQTNSPDISEEAETAMSSKNDPEEKPKSDEPQMDPMASGNEEELDALDWLSELTADEANVPTDAPSEPPIATEGMPSWLASKAPDAGVEVVDEWDSESAEIPDWLQDPVELSDLDDDSVLNAPEAASEVGLTGLLSEMEVADDEALQLDDMDSFLSDWVDEDDESGLSELLGVMDSGDSADPLADVWDGDDGLDFLEDEAVETAVSTPPDQAEQNVGLTGLLSNISVDTALPEVDPAEEDDFLSDLLGEAEDDDLSGFLWDEPLAEDSGDSLGLDELDLENVSLTAMLSDLDEPGEAVVEATEPEDALDLDNVSITSMLSDWDESEPAAEPVESESGEGDWFSDLGTLDDDDDDDIMSFLDDMTESSADEDTEDEAESELGLTGLLANLRDESDEAWDEADLAETTLDDVNFDEASTDNLGLTALLAGIDYDEDLNDPRPELPEIGDPVEESLTEILDIMDVEEDDEGGFVSAEDTTWLTQLEADTGALRERAEQFDMAEETGLDWLTIPDEPEEEPEEVEEAPAEVELAEPHVVEEPDSTPEDWDDAMSWLEELAAQQEDPVGELPSVAENMLDEELDSAESLVANVASDNEGVDWLEDLTGAAEDWLDEPEDLLEGVLEDEETDLPELAVTAVSEPTTPEDDFEIDETFDADMEMSWLDELATDRLAGIDIPEAETLAETSEPADLEDGTLDEDLAEANAWLSEIAADEEDLLSEHDLFDGDLVAFDGLGEMDTAVDEADLDWLDAVNDAEDDLFDDEPEGALAEELADAAPEAPAEAADEIHRTTGVTDALKADDGLAEAEADLEDALAWLDELDEEPAAELLDEAPPTVVTSSEPMDLPDFTDVADEPETVIVEPEPDALTLALERLEQQVRNEGIAVPDTAVLPAPVSDNDLFAALDWIEASEASETAVAPDTEWPETADEPDELEMIFGGDAPSMEEDPAAWLEELLSGDAELDVDMEPPPIKPSEDAMFVTDDAAMRAPEEIVLPELEGEPLVEEQPTGDFLLDEVALEGLPDDPDAAVAWLDQLVSGDEMLDIEMEPPPIKPSEDAMFVTGDTAVAEEAPVEEAPVEEELIEEEPEASLETDASEADSLFGMEDDPEAWLEQMLSGDFTMDVEMEPPPIKPSEDAMFVTDDATRAEPEPAIEELSSEPDPEPLEEPTAELEDTASDEADLDGFDFGDMEADPEAWLEQMLSGDFTMDVEMEPPPIKPSEDAMFVTDDAAQAEPEPEPEPSAAVQTEEPADDIIADVPDDPDEAMAWLEQLAARQGASLDELPSVTELDDDLDLPDWMAQDLLEESDSELDMALFEADEPEPEPKPVAKSFPETGELTDVDVDSELPDWLESAGGQANLGETGWLSSLPDVDIDSWLSAEEEATTAGPVEEPRLPDTGPLRSSVVAQPEPAPEDRLFEPVIEPSTGAYSVDSSKLGVAQAALANGRVQEAISQFKLLVTEGSGMMAVIAELEQAADAHPQVPALFQVLGDAYMRNGQLQKALASYRSALNQM